MANILIIGFEKTKAEELRDQIDVIAFQLEDDSATVIVDTRTRRLPPLP